MNKTILKQIVKGFQEFRFPLICPRDIKIPLDSKKWKNSIGIEIILLTATRHQV